MQRIKRYDMSNASNLSLNLDIPEIFPVLTNPLKQKNKQESQKKDRRQAKSLTQKIIFKKTVNASRNRVLKVPYKCS